MNQSVHADIHQSGVSQHARHLWTDGPVNPVHFRVSVEDLQKTGLCGERWIASLSGRIGLMQSNNTTRSDEPDHLPHQEFRFWHVYENQARSAEIE